MQRFWKTRWTTHFCLCAAGPHRHGGPAKRRAESHLVAPQRRYRVIEHIADDPDPAVNRGQKVTALQRREEACSETVWIRIRIQLTAVLKTTQPGGQMPLPRSE